MFQRAENESKVFEKGRHNSLLLQEDQWDYGQRSNGWGDTEMWRRSRGRAQRQTPPPPIIVPLGDTAPPSLALSLSCMFNFHWLVKLTTLTQSQVLANQQSSLPRGLGGVPGDLRDVCPLPLGSAGPVPVLWTHLLPPSLLKLHL